MTILPIQVLGASILRTETAPVVEITDEMQQLIDDMFETMHAAMGIGLAAPQVGRSERVAVIEVEGTRLVAINPAIIDERGIDRAEEGCLSIPEIYGEVERSSHVTVCGTGRDGEMFTIEADGLLARCLQHEIDHLHGKLFIDYLSFLKKRAVMAKWELQKSKYPDLLRILTPDVIRRLRDEHADEDEDQ